MIFYFTVSQSNEKSSKSFRQGTDMIRFTFYKDHPLPSVPAVSSCVHLPRRNAVH